MVVLPLIVSAGCNAASRRDYFYFKDLTPLGNAARHDDLATVKKLLAAGADVNQREKNGETALYDALECGQLNCDNVPIVDELVDHGAVVNLRLPYWGTPLTFSLTRDYGNPLATMELLKRGETVATTCDGTDGDVSLATQDSSVDVIRALLERGAKANCKNERGATALYWAAINGQADRAEVLLQHGADPNALEVPVGESKPVPLLLCVTTTNPDQDVMKRFEETRIVLKRYGARAELPTP